MRPRPRELDLRTRPPRQAGIWWAGFWIGGRRGVAPERLQARIAPGVAPATPLHNQRVFSTLRRRLTSHRDRAFSHKRLLCEAPERAGADNATLLGRIGSPRITRSPAGGVHKKRFVRSTRAQAKPSSRGSPEAPIRGGVEGGCNPHRACVFRSVVLAWTHKVPGRGVGRIAPHIKSSRCRSYCAGHVKFQVATARPKNTGRIAPGTDSSRRPCAPF